MSVLRCWSRDIGALGIRRLGVGVSGGADSSALAAVLAELGRSLGLTEIRLIHLDHGIRSAVERARERRAVRALAKALGLPLDSRRRRVRAGRGGLEATARRARLGCYAEVAGRRMLDAVATGHHLHDRAETMMLFLMRGAGSRGMSSLRPVERIGDLTLVRPLIDCPPALLRGYLAERGIGFVEDRTNASRRFTRNRIRHDLMPLMEKIQAGAAAHLAEAARILDEESHALQASADAEFDNLTLKSRSSQNHTNQGVVLSRPGLARLPAALAARVIQLLLKPAPELDAQSLRAAVQAACGTERRRFDVSGGRQLHMRAGRVWVEQSRSGVRRAQRVRRT